MIPSKYTVDECDTLMNTTKAKLILLSNKNSDQQSDSDDDGNDSDSSDQDETRKTDSGRQQGNLNRRQREARRTQATTTIDTTRLTTTSNHTDVNDQCLDDDIRGAAAREDVPEVGSNAITANDIDDEHEAEERFACDGANMCIKGSGRLATEGPTLRPLPTYLATRIHIGTGQRTHVPPHSFPRSFVHMLLSVTWPLVGVHVENTSHGVFASCIAWCRTLSVSLPF